MICHAHQSELQARLKALGFYTGESNGRYNSATADAVKAYQSEAGLEQTGEADVALQEAMRTSDVCTGTAVEQKEGMEGPVISALQRVLKALQYYNGDCTGKFDAATSNAIRLFTKSNGLAETPVATTAAQQAIRNQFRECESQYGAGNYELSIEEVASSMAKLKKAEKLYKSASTGSKKLKSVSKGAEVLVISRGKNWTKVQYRGATGYMRTNRLKFFTHIDYVAVFNARVQNAIPDDSIAAGMDENPTEEAVAPEAPETPETAQDPEASSESAQYDEDTGLFIEEEQAAEDQTEIRVDQDSASGPADTGEPLPQPTESEINTPKNAADANPESAPSLPDAA